MSKVPPQSVASLVLSLHQNVTFADRHDDDDSPQGVDSNEVI
jgi:hypothetical protein